MNACGLEAEYSQTIRIAPSTEIVVWNEATHQNRTGIDTVVFYNNQNNIDYVTLVGQSRWSTKVNWFDEGWNELSEINPSNHNFQQDTLAIYRPEYNQKLYFVSYTQTCSDTDSIYIRVNFVSLITNDRTHIVCSGETVELYPYNYQNMSGATYTWTNPYLTTYEHDPVATIDPDSTTIVYLEVVYDGITEYDSYKIIVDTVLIPEFGMTYYEDYRVCFQNETENANESNKVYWDFGDGSAIDSNKNVCHDFPSDTTAEYTICMTIINDCGTVDTCQTINFVGGAINSRVATLVSPTILLTPSITKEKVGKNAKRPILLENIPNPFEITTTFTYRLDKEIKSAHIQIIDMLGRQVATVNLEVKAQAYQFQSENLPPGLYICKLITNEGFVNSIRITKQ